MSKSTPAIILERNDDGSPSKLVVPTRDGPMGVCAHPASKGAQDGALMARFHAEEGPFCIMEVKEPEPARFGTGPAAVSSAKYRANWERIFGKQEPAN